MQHVRKQMYVLPLSQIGRVFFLNADYHVLKSTVMPHRVVICKVREKSFRMRYYELFWTNFDPYNEHFSYVHCNQ